MHKKLICKNNQKKQNKVFFVEKKLQLQYNILQYNNLQNVKNTLVDKKNGQYKKNIVAMKKND